MENVVANTWFLMKIIKDFHIYSENKCSIVVEVIDCYAEDHGLIPGWGTTKKLLTVVLPPSLSGQKQKDASDEIVKMELFHK